MSSAWDELNQRQQTYMKLIFEHDQIQERNERMRSSSRLYAPHRSADEWRPILYADTAYGHTPFKQAIKDAGMVDPGTGSTFEALSKRGYITLKYDRASSHPRSDVLIWIRLTTKGRALVRRALGADAPAKLPVGTLREWHWKALCRAYAGGDDGFSYDTDTGDGFGYVSWNTVLRLRDYKYQGRERPLVASKKYPSPPRQIAVGYSVDYVHYMCITFFGKMYYAENYQRYREMYPGVDAPAPEEKESE